MLVGSQSERWNSPLARKRQKIAGHCSCSCILCSGEDVVQLLSHIVETWMYRPWIETLQNPEIWKNPGQLPSSNLISYRNNPEF